MRPANEHAQAPWAHQRQSSQDPPSSLNPRPEKNAPHTLSDFMHMYSKKCTGGLLHRALQAQAGTQASMLCFTRASQSMPSAVCRSCLRRKAPLCSHDLHSRAIQKRRRMPVVLTYPLLTGASGVSVYQRSIYPPCCPNSAATCCGWAPAHALRICSSVPSSHMRCHGAQARSAATRRQQPTGLPSAVASGGAAGPPGPPAAGPPAPGWPAAPPGWPCHACAASLSISRGPT